MHGTAAAAGISENGSAPNTTGRLQRPAIDGARKHELAQREIKAKRIRQQRLTPSDREKFLAQWKLCQAQFVDDPVAAVTRADQLLAEIMRTRGYSTENIHERMVDIAAAYPHHSKEYREAGRILELHSHNQASTDDLRTAFLHYRTIFDDLLGGYDEELRRVS